MKSVIKASVSGIGFDFDEDAYDIISSYLDRLEAGYAQSPDGKEIVADIEARIAELLLSGQNADEPVKASIASQLVSQLGFPDDMPGAQGTSGRLERRLYRSAAGARLGGVCSGLGTFFGVDPVWVRLGIFVPLFLTIVFGALGWGHSAGLAASLFGVAVLLYFILWFAIPAARTPRQKLEMRGERVTAASIRDTLVTDSRTATPEARRSASVWAELTYMVGRIVLFLLKALALIVAFGLAMGAIGLTVAFVVLLAGGGAVAEWLAPLEAMQGVTPGIYASLVILAVLLPIVLLCWLLLKALFSMRGGRAVFAVIGGVWLIIVVYLSVITVRNVDNFDFGGFPYSVERFYDDI